MRSIGMVLIVIGIAIAYLGWNRKLGASWSALTTGKAPDPNGSNSVNSGIQVTDSNGFPIAPGI